MTVEAGGTPSCSACTPVASFGLTGFPYGVEVDGDDRVVARPSGEVDPDVVEELLSLAAEA